jgi:hypothetical protein
MFGKGAAETRRGAGDEPGAGSGGRGHGEVLSAFWMEMGPVQGMDATIAQTLFVD